MGPKMRKICIDLTADGTIEELECSHNQTTETVSEQTKRINLIDQEDTAENMNRESSWRQVNPENSAPASPDPGAYLEVD